MEQPAPFEHRLRVAPEGPGVYIMKDARGGVLYVGKASSLRNRVRSYFGSPAGLPPKIQRMVSKVSDFDFIVTNSEAEALILECNLIKRFRPPYNARLKDDKNYPYIKIDLKEDFPLVYITRKVLLDGARYFGPFATAWSVRRTLDLLKKLFPYRSCTRSITGKDPRPCLDYYIHRCVGPCIGAASKEEYRQVIQQVIQFLEGRTEGVVEELRRSMLEAAERQEFERAAVLRDQVQAIQRVTQEQQIRVSFVPQTDLDAVAMTSGKDQSWVEAFFIRQGKLVGRDHFMMEGTQDDTPGAVLAEFVKQFYDSASYIPPQILLQHPLEEQALIRQWLRERRGGPIQLRAPQRGSLRRLVDMVAQNAVQGLEQMRVKWLGNASALEQALEELQEALNLPRPPQRIECYDISNIQGTSPVGSMVVFEGGRPKPAHYRRFQVRGVPGINDYAMMHEVLRRRFKRLGTLRPF
ncbi:MAG: excinuclease ABC subunit UvrC, partial [Dehalococcoidia bacterium]